MKLAILQTKPRKGDLVENFAHLAAAFTQLAAEERPYDVIVLPEAALTGYFLEGAVYESSFEASVLAEQIAKLWRAAPGSQRASVDVVVGFYENAAGTYYNSALYLTIGPDTHEIVHVHRKMFLPTYGVFDEERFLSRGRRLQAFETRFGRAAIAICEDAWHALVPAIAAIKGAQVLYVPSASPGRGLSRAGRLESVEQWRELLRSYAVEHGIYVVYAGLAGFEGGKGMTGSSMLIAPDGEIVAAAPALGAHVIRAELDFGEIDLARASLPLLGDLNAVLPDLLFDPELVDRVASREATPST